MPEVIVIDEIGTELEAHAARTIAERGVQLIGTAHGNNLDNLMLNPTLSDLIGGIQTVTLGDDEAPRSPSSNARPRPPLTSSWRSPTATAFPSMPTSPRRWTRSCAATPWRPRCAGATRAECTA